MATMQYNGYEFIPVPLLTLSKTTERSGGEVDFVTEVSLSFNGFLLEPSGALSSASGFSESWNNKDELEAALSENRKNLLITDDDGKILLNVFPDVASVTFAEGIWVRQIPFTVEMSYQEDSPSGIRSFDENWSYSEDEQGVISVVHTVSTVGLNTDKTATGANNAFANAKAFALKQINNDVASTFLDITGLSQKSNVIKSEDFNEVEATYNLSETFILRAGGDTIREEFTISINNTPGSRGGSIAGTVFGLGDDPATRFANADAALSGVLDLGDDRVQDRASFTINPIAIANSQSYNEFIGEIGYTLEFDDNVPDTAGAIEETIRVSYTRPSETFAAIPIPGRATGPILQDLGTQSLTTKTLSVDIQFDKEFSGNKTFNFNPFIPTANPNFISSFSETFDEKTFRYTLNISWIFNGSDSGDFA